MIDLPKILVFTITYDGKDYVFDEFKNHVNKITYPKEFYRHIFIDNTRDNGEYAQRLRDEGFETFKLERGNNTREAIARSQEFARKIAVSEGYDYLMSIESDILVTPNIIQQLIGNCKEVVGALYFIGDEQTRLPCITIPKKHKITGLIGTRLLEKSEIPQYVNKGLIPVTNCGLGCTLIERQVFEKIVFFYYPDLKGHSDSFFSNDVWRLGYRVYCDTDIILEHKNIPWSTVDDR